MNAWPYKPGKSNRHPHDNVGTSSANRRIKYFGEILRFWVMDLKFVIMERGQVFDNSTLLYKLSYHLANLDQFSLPNIFFIFFQDKIDDGMLVRRALHKINFLLFLHCHLACVPTFRLPIFL